MRAAFRAYFNADLPGAGQTVTAGTLRLSSVGPGAWLISDERGACDVRGKIGSQEQHDIGHLFGATQAAHRDGGLQVLAGIFELPAAQLVTAADIVPAGNERAHQSISSRPKRPPWLLSSVCAFSCLAGAAGAPGAEAAGCA